MNKNSTTSLLLAASILGLSMNNLHRVPEVRKPKKSNKVNPPRKHKQRGTGGQGGKHK